MLVKVQPPAPPVGLVEVRTSPSLSTATHWVGAGPSAAVSCTLPPPWVKAQLDAGPVGAVATSSSPTVSPLTQRLELGQEMP